MDWRLGGPALHEGAPLIRGKAREGKTGEGKERRGKRERGEVESWKGEGEGKTARLEGERGGKGGPGEAVRKRRNRKLTRMKGRDELISN